jgi:hypothetical protein
MRPQSHLRTYKPRNVHPVLIMHLDLHRYITHALRPRLRTAEQELQVLRTQAVHCHLVVVDSSRNHRGLLLLQRDHTRLNAVFDAQACDDAGSLLPDAVAAVCRLPLGGGVPPSMNTGQYV